VTRGASARLFVALEPPLHVREQLAAWARIARRGNQQIRLPEPEAMHVTLCFLGSRAVAEIGALGEAALACAMPVGGLGLGAPLWLPSRRPRALAVEVHDAKGELASLQAAVAEAMSRACGWEPEHRRYRPHVTVARMRAGAAPRERGLDPTPAFTFEGESLTLFRSWLSRDGASCEAVAGCPCR
jgi:RNA 2',3'-cyclic 3'-phosphodiesterase